MTTNEISPTAPTLQAQPVEGDPSSLSREQLQELYKRLSEGGAATPRTGGPRFTAPSKSEAQRKAVKAKRRATRAARKHNRKR